MSTVRQALQDLGHIRQLGYVVSDLDAAVRGWGAGLGVGPWLVIRNVPLACVYRGAPSRPMVDIALAYRGGMQIELIRQTDAAPSPYRPFIERGQYGLHHTAYLCERMQDSVEALQAAGLTLVCDINMPTGGRYVYFESPVPGEQSLVELLEATPAMRQMFEQGIAAAAAWDGGGVPTVMDFAALAAADPRRPR
ncbi:MAG: VOC family protein [Nevskia sp.]|nr:VOC family protein [Nevskia sp.]